MFLYGNLWHKYANPWIPVHTSVGMRYPLYKDFCLLLKNQSKVLQSYRISLFRLSYSFVLKKAYALSLFYFHPFYCDQTNAMLFIFWSYTFFVFSVLWFYLHFLALWFSICSILRICTMGPSSHKGLTVLTNNRFSPYRRSVRSQTPLSGMVSHRISRQLVLGHHLQQQILRSRMRFTRSNYRFGRCRN